MTERYEDLMARRGRCRISASGAAWLRRMGHTGAGIRRRTRQHWAMTSEVIVRAYAEGDYGVCRSLWAELTEYHRTIYGDPSIGGDDPGAGFDHYLAEPRLVGSWVAESRDRVIGLTGLFDRGTSGEIEPVPAPAVSSTWPSAR